MTTDRFAFCENHGGLARKLYAVHFLRAGGSVCYVSKFYQTESAAKAALTRASKWVRNHRRTAVIVSHTVTEDCAGASDE